MDGSTFFVVFIHPEPGKPKPTSRWYITGNKSNMRNTLFLSLAAVALIFASCDKADESATPIFSEVFPYTTNGQTLYYRIIGDHAEVTHPVPSWTNHIQPEGDIVIPETAVYKGQSYTVTSIGDSAFYDCDLQAGSEYINVTIPPTVCSLGDNSLYFAGDACKIKCLPQNPPEIVGIPFVRIVPGGQIEGPGSIIGGVDREVQIKVPCESIELYKNAAGWSEYASMIECIED